MCPFFRKVTRHCIWKGHPLLSLLQQTEKCFKTSLSLLIQFICLKLHRHLLNHVHFITGKGMQNLVFLKKLMPRLVVVKMQVGWLVVVHLGWKGSVFWVELLDSTYFLSLVCFWRGIFSLNP